MSESSILIELDIVIRNGSAEGTAIARDADTGKAIHIGKGDWVSAIVRTRFANTVAEKLGDEDAVEEIEAKLVTELDERIRLAVSTPSKPVDPAALLAEMPQYVREDALSKLQDPELIEEIKTDIRAMGVSGDERTGLGLYLIGTSRLLQKPLSAIVRGPSSGGKSYLIQKVTALFPPESKLEAHRISPTALYYMPDNALVHKFVAGGERSRRQDDESADATRALREMLSDGILRGVVTQKVDGRLQAIPFEKRGPIAFVESTSNSHVFAEDENRSLVFCVDESREQTRNIVGSIAKVAANGGNDAESIIVPVHHAMQRMLKPLSVRILYAPLLAERFPVQRVEARRAMPQLVGMIQAVALLRQYQKLPENGVLIADAQDYSVALDIIKPTLARLRGGLDEGVKRLWHEICDRVAGEKEFTRREAMVWSGTNQGHTNARLLLLAESGFLIETQEARGSRPGKFKVKVDAPAIDSLDAGELPTPAEIQEFLEKDKWV